MEIRVQEAVGDIAAGHVSRAIANNEIIEDTISAAGAADAQEDATFVVFGGLGRQTDDFEVHTFVVDVEHRAIARLDRTRFDFELLTTDTDALRVALDAKHAVVGRVAESEDKSGAPTVPDHLSTPT